MSGNKCFPRNTDLIYLSSTDQQRKSNEACYRWPNLHMSLRNMKIMLSKVSQLTTPTSKSSQTPLSTIELSPWSGKLHDKSTKCSSEDTWLEVVTKFTLQGCCSILAALLEVFTLAKSESDERNNRSNQTRDEVELITTAHRSTSSNLLQFKLIMTEYFAWLVFLKANLAWKQSDESNLHAVEQRR